MLGVRLEVSPKLPHAWDLWGPFLLGFLPRILRIGKKSLRVLSHAHMSFKFLCTARFGQNSTNLKSAFVVRWRVCFWVSVIPAAVLALSMELCAESPHWLFKVLLPHDL